MPHDKVGDITSRFAGYLYWGMRLFVAFAALVFLTRGDFVAAFSAAAISALMSLPSFLKAQYRIYLPFELDLAIVVFIFLTLFLGSQGNFYEQFFWWDDLLHLLSGILFGIIGFVLIYILNSEHVGKLNLTPFFVSLFSVCFALAMSVVWEIYEFAIDLLLGFNMQRDGLNDTMSDLIVNAMGALMVACIAYFWIQRQKRVPFTPRRLSRFQYKGRSKNLSK
jgi:uncharacterized membrane protein YjdF